MSFIYKKYNFYSNYAYITLRTKFDIYILYVKSSSDVIWPPNKHPKQLVAADPANSNYLAIFLILVIIMGAM